MASKRNFYKKVSGSSVGAKRIRVLACEECSYTSAYKTGQELRTGSVCPKCLKESLRVFDSKREFEVFRRLKLECNLPGMVCPEITCQVKMPLYTVSTVGRLDSPPELIKLYDYILDFVVRYPDGRVRYIDVKGSSGTGDKKRFVATDVAIMKIKHFEAQYNAEVEILS